MLDRYVWVVEIRYMEGDWWPSESMATSHDIAVHHMGRMREEMPDYEYRVHRYDAMRGVYG